MAHLGEKFAFGFGRHISFFLRPDPLLHLLGNVFIRLTDSIHHAVEGTPHPPQFILISLRQALIQVSMRHLLRSPLGFPQG